MSQSNLLLMLHILSAVIWIGGMIAVRLVVHPINLQFEDLQQKIDRNLQVTKRLLVLVFPFVIISITTGIVMVATNKSSTIDTKEAIWLVMFLNYLFIAYRRNTAQRAFNNFDITGARKVMSPIANILLPINIILGVIAIYMGIVLRGI